MRTNMDEYAHPSDVTSFKIRVGKKIKWLKVRIFVLTFFAYALYSGTRQPFGITKSALNPDKDKNPDETGYAPFDDSSWGSTYLGACDTVFLSFYAIGLFITGPMGDRVNLRWFLGVGMFGSGAFAFLFGAASLMGIHNIAWFIGCNIFAGLFQATGWPSTVTLMSRWFGKGNRGTIMGIWNAQSSVGNIIGKFWATFWLHQYGWGYAFMGTGLLCIFVGLIQFIFIVPHPHDVLTDEEQIELELLNSQGHIAQQSILSKEDEARLKREAAALKVLQEESAQRNRSSSMSSALPHHHPLDPHHHQDHHDHADEETAAVIPLNVVPTIPEAAARHLNFDDYPSISFMEAVRVPGVIEYSACLFFSKLVAYAFTFWLPYYLSNLNYSDNTAGNISTVYDIGGVAGGVLAGWGSDYTGKRGLVSVTMLLLSLPGLWIYSYLATLGIGLNIVLMFVVGILVNGPYTLISGVVAADLGSHPSLKGNPKAMSTVTGIIDGSGSVGAALQGVLIGLVGQKLGWTNVFYLLEMFCLFAAICLFRIMRKELGPRSSWRSFGEMIGWSKPVHDLSSGSHINGGDEDDGPHGVFHKSSEINLDHDKIVPAAATSQVEQTKWAHSLTPKRKQIIDAATSSSPESDQSGELTRQLIDA